MNNPYDQNETCDGCGYDASDCRCTLWHADICGTPWAQRETPVFQVLADSAQTARTLIARANNVDELRVQVLPQGNHSNAHDDLQIANNGITFDVEGGTAWVSADRFEHESERITLSTGQDADGQPEVGYINQTENFGGRFTGV